MRITRSPTRLISDITVNQDIDMLTLYQLTQLATPASGEALRKGNKDITNAEIADAAAIAYSKLALALLIRNSDVKADAAIVRSKLNFGDGLVNADIAAAAAIVSSKLADGGKIATIVRKTADQAVINSTTLVNDTHLLFPVGASEIWEFELFLIVECLNGGADWKFNIAVPSGAAGQWLSQPKCDGTGSNAVVALGTNIVIDSANTPISFVIFRGIVVVSTTAGNVQLQWAQNVSQDNNNTIYTNSCILAHKLA